MKAYHFLFIVSALLNAYLSAEVTSFANRCYGCLLNSTANIYCGGIEKCFSL